MLLDVTSISVLNPCPSVSQLVSGHYLKLWHSAKRIFTKQVGQAPTDTFFKNS